MVQLFMDGFQMPSGESAEIIAANGLFIVDRVFNNGQLVAEGCTRVWSGENYKIQGFKPMQEGLKYHLPKITAPLLRAVEGLFDWVVDTYHSESMALLYYSPLAPEGLRWQVRPPKKQSVTGAGIHYEFPETPRGFSVAGDIHSHTDFNAFHSGVDEKDEVGKTGLFVTLGHNGSGQRRTIKDYDCSFMIRGRRFTLKPEEVFEGFEKSEFPDSWKFTVEKETPPICVGGDDYMGGGIFSSHTKSKKGGGKWPR